MPCDPTNQRFASVSWWGKEGEARGRGRRGRTDRKQSDWVHGEQGDDLDERLFRDELEFCRQKRGGEGRHQSRVDCIVGGSSSRGYRSVKTRRCWSTNAHPPELLDPPVRAPHDTLSRYRPTQDAQVSPPTRPHRWFRAKGRAGLEIGP